MKLTLDEEEWIAETLSNLNPMDYAVLMNKVNRSKWEAYRITDERLRIKRDAFRKRNRLKL